MALFWGVEAPPVLERVDDIEAMIAEGDRCLLKYGFAAADDLVVIVAGTPGGRRTTNRVIVHQVGQQDVPLVPTFSTGSRR